MPIEFKESTSHVLVSFALFPPKLKSYHVKLRLVKVVVPTTDLDNSHRLTSGWASATSTLWELYESTRELWLKDQVIRVLVDACDIGDGSFIYSWSRSINRNRTNTLVLSIFNS
ncbi:hypothetical protein WICANDRAFT_86659 [Wickerhamomyces anomalus NRRL Y-366-8]|uniref:Uncharacterized protein n=1 Tax=Wickerhamomyces anomalus (strain ATCC 58044 / CBS 1984 / NCYC 433 / NRRL Y-366-8) TaxID=683960 RepID=A0A1E3P8P0_WICAA|nr:uncharacterized protein WICANDRAFT_86659 [Wickerhamomyces anomalus NRRL Y-366-8]ODQ61738.1 hypothetical protein WICANDRAFT_86659 [Wickerhamomyces anomalus NRRL Y-366-8]